MFPWLRLGAYAAKVRSRPRLELPADTSRLAFRVGPTDLDFSLHMNNGRYLTLMDFGRIDIMVASGLWRDVRRNGWVPIASNVIIRFRRELRAFDRFELQSQIIDWDADSVVIEQKFVFTTRQHIGQVAAVGLFKGGVYDRAKRAFVPTRELMQTIDVAAPQPTRRADVAAFLAANAALSSIKQVDA